MKIFTLLLGSALVFPTTIHAQQAPWTNLPPTKNVATIEGEERRLRLKLDTLTIQEAEDPAIPFYAELKHGYNQPPQMVGYGYVTEEGKPFGVWHYYTVNSNAYELFCEGYLESLSAEHLEVDEQYANRQSSIDFKDTKRAFASEAKQKTFFTGEWRFYKGGKLDRIVTLNNKVTLPLSEVLIFNDEGEHSRTDLVVVHPGDRHMSGQVLSIVYFSPDGRVTRIIADGVNLTFNKDGKPVIEPLQEPIYLQ